MPIAYFRNTEVTPSPTWQNPDNWSDDVAGVSDFDGGSGEVPWVSVGYENYDIRLATGHPEALSQVSVGSGVVLNGLGDCRGDDAGLSFPPLALEGSNEITSGEFYLVNLIMFSGIISGGIFEMENDGYIVDSQVTGGDWSTSPGGLDFAGTSSLSGTANMSPLSGLVNFSEDATASVTNDVTFSFTFNATYSGTSSAPLLFSDGSSAVGATIAGDASFIASALCQASVISDAGSVVFFGGYSGMSNCSVFGDITFTETTFVSDSSFAVGAVARFYDQAALLYGNAFGSAPILYSKGAIIAAITDAGSGSSFSGSPPIILLPSEVFGGLLL